MHLCAHLPESLFVDTGNGQRRLILLDAALGGQTLGLGFDPLRQRELNRMRVTQGEDNLAALHVCLVTNSDNIHLPAEPFGNTDDGVVR